MLAHRRQKSVLTRIPLLIKVTATGRLVDARFVATELGNDGLDCFVNRPLARGEGVTLVFEQPRHFLLKGLVSAWFPFSRSTRVLGQDPFSYRAKIAFEIESDAERVGLGAFRAELA